jgi:hypothetical protein
MHITYKQAAARQLKNQSNMSCYKQVAATQLKAIMDPVKERRRRGLFVANASKNKFLSSVGAVC